jgi:hypothetical protein
MAISTGGGDALVAGLRVLGIDTVFGLPRAQTSGLFDAIHRSHPTTRHGINEPSNRIRAERVGTPGQFSRVLNLAIGSDRP